MTDNNYNSLLLEDLLDDIESSDAPKKTAAQKLAADLSDADDQCERPDYPNFIQLVFKQYIRIEDYRTGAIRIAKNLIKSAKRLQLVLIPDSSSIIAILNLSWVIQKTKMRLSNSSVSNRKLQKLV